MTFPCGNDTLVGILARAQAPTRRGIVIAPGGPQYRSGSHRQFTLLARYLAERGLSSLRFDYRGTGDSSGPLRKLESVDADLRAAVDAFTGAEPRLREVVLWGLCDAASDSLLYAPSDPRVTGLALLNPHVCAPRLTARAHLTAYYLPALRTVEAWRRLLSGRVRVRPLVAEMLHAVLGTPARTLAMPALAASEVDVYAPERLAAALRQFTGHVLLILSGRDLVAARFQAAFGRPQAWERPAGAGSVTRHVLPEADHTFSCQEWGDRVARWTDHWVRSW